jgi:hypothetical protein
MQRIARSRPVPDRSDGPLRRRRLPPTRCASRPAASTGLATLAPAFVQALPTLDTVPTAYSHELRAELLYDLCAALVREELAAPALWQKCEGSSVVFAERAIIEAIGKERWNLLQRNVEYHLSVSDVAERDGEAFYWTLTYALYRVMRIYNHDDALQYEERMREYAEDDEENRAQYEFPEVEKAPPECIRSTLTSEDRRAFLRHGRRLIAEHRSGRFGSWIERLRRIDRLSGIKLPVDTAFREDGGYDCHRLLSLSRTTTPSLPASTRKASTCLKGAPNRRSVSFSLHKIPKK